MRTSIHLPIYGSTELYFEMVQELLAVIGTEPLIKLDVKYDEYSEILNINFSHPEPEQQNMMQSLVLLYCPDYRWHC
ncbi:hypothetical protein [Leclercia adecarboxylata]|uniref:hypothetical protein n=1 Tax=Leclercia adecarboxylata TaxID=83655 RepID=UPI00124C8279|nr:hypothetical protein [Leclercia adecarboxylata]QFH49354.1 hypothetical protein FR819_08775 [Leclercia adecarboxylata]